MSKTVCFGEIMLRLNPPGQLRLTQTGSLELNFGGAEANVAVMLSQLGLETEFVTKLPTHDMGKTVVNHLSKYGVSTPNIVFGGERVGIYYVEHGSSQRSSRVIYDRKNSSISQASQTDFNWSKIFDGAKIFHFTGITPALSRSAAEICDEACRAAKAAGLIISCDINYRSALWSEQEAGSVMSGFMPFVDLLVVNEEHAAKLFGVIANDKSEDENGFLNHNSCFEICRRLSDKFGSKLVAMTLRRTLSADDNIVGGVLYSQEKDECAFSRPYKVHIVDRIGAGDAFSGGLIYSLIKGYNIQEAVEIAGAASALKHSIIGDSLLVSEDELLSTALKNTDGRIIR